MNVSYEYEGVHPRFELGSNTVRVPVESKSAKSYWEHEFERASAKMDKALDMLSKFEDMGEDDYEVGAVIQFDKRFAPGGRLYSYAAIKCENNLWYTTSATKNAGPFTWEQMANFLSEGVDEIWCVDTFKLVWEKDGS